MNTPHTQITCNCRVCGKAISVRVRQEDLDKWNNPDDTTPIQFVFPYLSPAKREILLTRICGQCWDRIFKEEEEE